MPIHTLIHRQYNEYGEELIYAPWIWQLVMEIQILKIRMSLVKIRYRASLNSDGYIRPSKVKKYEQEFK